MLQYIWLIEIAVITCALLIVFLLCFITDLPTVLGLSFSKKETIAKYIDKKLLKKDKGERTICTFRMIGTNKVENKEEVFIYMCLCRYRKNYRTLTTLSEDYKKGVVVLSRELGIYKVVSIDIKDDFDEYFLENIVSKDDYMECVNSKGRSFLKEANIKKAKKKFKLKKAFKV